MHMLSPGVTITRDAYKTDATIKSEFATIFICFTKQHSSKPELYFNYNEARQSSVAINNYRLNISLKSYFDNGGTQLYLLNYCENDFVLEEFYSFIRSYCDNIVDLEVITTQNLVDSETISSNYIVKVLSFLNQYAQDSDRFSITDVNNNIIDNYLDALGECVIYYPWFKNENGDIIAPSVIASALMSKIASQNKFFHSIANKSIVSLDKQERILSKDEASSLYKEGINPIISVHSQGLKIWGVSAFNSNYNSANELRVMKYIKRQLKALSKIYLFEVNSKSLYEKLYSKINHFLYLLWQSGALSGDSQDEAYLLKSSFDESKDAETRVIFYISVSISKPLEYINIKFERIEHDGIIEDISIEA